MMKWVKGRSSRKLQEEFSQLRKRYWGQHLWARGYFCATTGTVTEEAIQAYLDAHGQPQAPEGFKVEEPQ
jgi:putative transposase